jgi:2'-5' RNA ligase
MYDPPMPFGIILLPEAEATSRLVNFSREIASSAPSKMHLADNAPPHITLLHVDCDRATADRWWRSANPLVPKDQVVQSAGLTFSPIDPGDYYVPDGGIFAGIEIVRRSTLEDAHQEVLRLARESDAKPLGAVGEDFRPHITISILDHFPVDRIPFDGKLVTSSFRCHLAYGELGSCGTFPKIIDPH